MEETGYEAETLRLLYTYAPALGYSSELIHIYSGRISRDSRRRSTSGRSHPWKSWISRKSGRSYGRVGSWMGRPSWGCRSSVS